MNIKRKFIVAIDGKELNEILLSAKKTTKICQTYIRIGNPEYKLLKIDEEYFLSIIDASLQNQAQITKLTQREYELSLRNATSESIIKTKYEIPLKNDLTANLEIFNGENQGYATVEVEFLDGNQAKTFVVPQWFGYELK